MRAAGTDDGASDPVEGERPGDGDRRLADPLSCNTVDVADMHEERPGAITSARTTPLTFGPNGERVRPTPYLVLHVCCTQADLIISAASD